MTDLPNLSKEPEAPSGRTYTLTVSLAEFLTIQQALSMAEGATGKEANRARYVALRTKLAELTKPHVGLPKRGEQP